MGNVFYFLYYFEETKPKNILSMERQIFMITAIFNHKFMCCRRFK